MIDWQRIWNDENSSRRFSPTRAGLYLISLVYRLVVALRNRLYDRQILTSVKLSCPVISIGNITVGGTGKTPCVIYLARMLQRRGFRPAVISRGYGGRATAPVNVVSDGKTIYLDASTCGDEPLLIAQTLPDVPVITGARRHLPGQAAIERFGANVILCDDAFQHRALHRDVDIVLLDGQKPLGNGHLLPRGELRESPCGLRRAGCLILTRADFRLPADERIAVIARQSNIPIFRATHQFTEIVQPVSGLRLSPDQLRGKTVCAFCGIAKPASFESLLVEVGAKILSFNPFPDHHVFSTSDIEELEKQFIQLRADYLITTAKDAMRLAAWPDLLQRISIVQIAMNIQPEDSFETFIVEWINALLIQDKK